MRAEQQKHGGTGGRPWLWQKRQSGNPAGRPKGGRSEATLLLEELLSGEEVERLVKLFYARAVAGSVSAQRFLLSRLLPPVRHPRIAFDMPESTGEPQRDAAAALEALTRAVAAGEIAPAEAKLLASYVEQARRLKAAAPAKAAVPANPPAAKPAPAAAPSVFSSVLPPPRGSRRDALLAGAAALPPAGLDALRPRAAA